MESLDVFSLSSGSPRVPWNESSDWSVLTPNVATKTLAVFRLADNWFGVDLECIERVTPADYLTRFAPGSSLPFDGLMLGTVGIHDRLVSVIDLKALFGIGCSSVHSYSTILIVRSGAHELGLFTDEFVDVFFVPQSQIYQYPEDNDPALGSIVTGECICGNRVITIIEPEGISRRLASLQTAVHVTAS